MSEPRDPPEHDEAAGRVAFVYLLFGAAFVAATEVALTASPNPNWQQRTAVRVAFLALSAALLVVLVRRELTRRRAAESRLAAFDEVLVSMGLVTESSADLLSTTRLVVLADRILEAVGADGVRVTDRSGEVLVEAGPAIRSGESLPPDGRVVVPLHTGGRDHGTMEVLRRGSDVSTADERLLEIVAQRLAGMLAQRSLFEAEHRARVDAERARRRLEMLSRVSLRMSEALDDVEQAISQALGAVAPEFCDVAELHLTEADEAMTGDPSVPARFGGPDAKGPVAEAIDTGSSQLLSDSEQEPDVQVAGMQSAVVVPLVVAGRPRGALGFANGRGRPAFSSADVEAFGQVAVRVANAIERSELHSEVRRSEQRLAAIVDSSPLGILELEPVTGRVVKANRSAASILGWPASGPPEPLLDEGSRHRLRDIWTQVMAGQVLVGVDVPVLRADGSTIDLSVSAAPVRTSDGSIELIVALLADVTERHQLERQLQQTHRLESLGRLAGGVAHDFNNLLTVVLGYSDLVLKRLSPDDESSRWDLEAVIRAGEQARDLTDQLLTLSRRRIVQATVVDPDEVIGSSTKVLERMVGPDVELLAELGEAPPVLIDRSQLEQVVLNIVVNADDALPQGGRIEIRTGAGRMPGTGASAAVISVTDDGSGMDDVTAEHCFEPFFTTKGRQDGTGLGLATVYGIVSQAGGEIAVDTAPGAGTTFRVHLPVETEAESDGAERVPRTDEGARILLVDDEEPVRKLVRTALERHGYDVIEAGSGSEALAALRAAPDIDLLVTDVVMPEMSGSEVARQLWRIRPRVPVLFVSGYAEDPDLHALNRRVPVRFLPKPFSTDQLVEAVDEVLAQP